MSHADLAVGFSPHSCRYLAKAAKEPREMRAPELLAPGRRSARTPTWCRESPATTVSFSRLPWRSSALDEVERTADVRALSRADLGHTWSSLGIDYGLATPRGISFTPSSGRRATSRSSSAAGTSREVALLREENEQLRARLGALERRLSSPISASGVATAGREDARSKAADEQHDHPLAQPRTVAPLSSGAAQHRY